MSENMQGTEKKEGTIQVADLVDHRMAGTIITKTMTGVMVTGAQLDTTTGGATRTVKETEIPIHVMTSHNRRSEHGNSRDFRNF